MTSHLTANNKRKSKRVLQSTRQQKPDICAKTYWCYCRELNDFPHVNEDDLKKEPRSNILHYLLVAQILEEEFGEAAIPNSEKTKRAMYELALNPNYQPSADVKDPSREKAKINYQLIHDMMKIQTMGLNKEETH